MENKAHYLALILDGFIQLKKKYVRMEINFILGKNGGHTSSSLEGWSIVAVRQMKYLQFTKVLKIHNFNSKVRLGCLNVFMVPIALYQQINSQYLTKLYCKAVFPGMGSHIFLVNPYY